MTRGGLTRTVPVGKAGLGRFLAGPPSDPGNGGPPPFREPPGQPAIDPARLGMLVFLGAETMVFAGFVAAYLVFRLGAPVWPPPLQPRLPIGLTGLNTAVLLLSGYTMWRAGAALRHAEPAGPGRRLALTAGLGAAFLGLQGYEWVRLLEFGLTAASGIYGGTFYVLIGAHGLHVLAALGWLALLLLRLRRDGVAPGRVVEVSVFAMYWYFVVALWPVLYVLAYLA